MVVSKQGSNSCRKSENALALFSCFQNASQKPGRFSSSSQRASREGSELTVEGGNSSLLDKDAANGLYICSSTSEAELPADRSVVEATRKIVIIFGIEDGTIFNSIGMSNNP
jgi:hypothetical protein